MKTNLVAELQSIIGANERGFYARFSETEIALFSEYYQFVLKWNSFLHLTTLTSPSEFAERHLLESAYASQKILKPIRQIWDVGSGLGIPGVPFAILRPDLSVNLIESNKKKAIFLRELITKLGINNLQVINQRFEEVNGVGSEACVVTRALDDMPRLIPKIIRYSDTTSQLLLFGNESLLEITLGLLNTNWSISSSVIPKSNNRLVISLTRFT